MLVLSRKPGESLIIGNQIKVTIVRVQGNRVKLGIEAPESCRVLRAELGDIHAGSHQADASIELWASDWHDRAAEEKLAAAP